MNLTRTNLTLTQLGAIFEAIVRGGSCLKRLNLSFVASWLGSLDPSLIGASLASLEEVVMEGVKLTKAQVCTKKKKDLGFEMKMQNLSPDKNPPEITFQFSFPKD